jgi:hypothetical protein
MSYHNPHASLTKICPVCSSEFSTIAHYNQLYCNVKCYRAAKHKRRVDRSNPAVPTKLDVLRQDAEASKYFATIYCPTVAQLDNYAKVILLEMNDGKPIRVTGQIPTWKPPKNIILAEQVGVEPKEWNLQFREPNPLDAILGS